jgi:hypothetical protein
MSSPDERRPSTFLRLTPDLAPVVDERRPSTFLNLAPDTSASYPRMPARKSSLEDSNPAKVANEVTGRKASSVAVGEGRILKLNPVHWGEHLDDTKEDFYDGPSP